MKRHALLIGMSLVLVLVFLGHSAKFYQIGLIQRLDAILYDYRLRLTMPQTPDERIVILDIDEKSLHEEGRWPWGRDRMALLLDKLFDRHKVAVAGFDIVFAEKDESSGIKVLLELARNPLRGVPQFQAEVDRLLPLLDYDSLFARSLLNRNAVLGYYFSNQSSHSPSFAAGVLPEPVFPPGTFNPSIRFASWGSYGGNLSAIQQSAASAGHFNPWVDSDGTVRRLPMIAEYQGAYYESLSLAMVRTLLGQPKLIPVYAPEKNTGYTGLEWLEMKLPQGNLRIPVDENTRTLIPYRGGQGSFRYISASDVLHDRIPPEDLKDRIILIGTSAPGLMDMRSTPVGEVYPGVEIHANVIAGILDQDFKQRPPYVMGMEVILLLVAGAMLSLTLPVLSPVKSIAVTLLFFFAALAGNGVMWHAYSLDVPLAASVLMIGSLFILNMSYGYFFESRTKRKITNLFGQYVPGELVDEMSRNPGQVSMDGESREMTVLFSDVRGFTAISETLDAKALSTMMNEFLTPLSRVIYSHRGTIDKYMGDCIMAFWGAPMPDNQHAQHAVLAGLEMQKIMETLRPEFRRRGWPELHVGVGINTGRVSVGNMGSEVRVAYTVMGDAVNLASRLESATREYGVDIIAGEDTKLVAPEIIYRELDQVVVKGKDRPVTIYEPVGPADQVSEDEMEEIKLFHQALRLYRKQDWDQAELQLYNLQRKAPQKKLYQVYMERVAAFRKNPPAADWNGIYEFTGK